MAVEVDAWNEDEDAAPANARVGEADAESEAATGAAPADAGGVLNWSCMRVLTIQMGLVHREVVQPAVAAHRKLRCAGSCCWLVSCLNLLN